MVKNKAYKFRLYPNEEQKVLFSKTFGCVRFVYNHYLAMRKTAYDTEKKSITY
ncbi:MAG: putative transposase, partial [Anaerosolibacter sp.]|uniref:helix-turn-helix domain-containing protein n=1 Tax=Anaerosolibacter sp. TaxID=1872527 RepID=UPI0026161447